ncbi:MAG: methyltransferase domain-containing protein [Gammaproteobacteria bacterium]|nr:methyltransferase domain-containing protein [Gammaproteobacteria bacterium]
MEQDAERIIGFDASTEMIRLARDSYADRVELRVHDFTEPLDFLDDGSIDVAICGLRASEALQLPTFDHESRSQNTPNRHTKTDRHICRSWRVVLVGGTLYDRTYVR